MSVPLPMLANLPLTSSSCRPEQQPYLTVSVLLTGDHI